MILLSMWITFLQRLLRNEIHLSKIHRSQSYQKQNPQGMCLGESEDEAGRSRIVWVLKRKNLRWIYLRLGNPISFPQAFLDVEL